MKAYLLSVTTAALFCTVLLELTVGQGTSAKTVRLLTGVFMLIIIARPAIDLRIDDFTRSFQMLEFSAEEAIAWGTDAAAEALCEAIEDRCVASILAQAKDLECEIDVDIVLENNMPQKVTLTGSVSPYAKRKLIAWIESNMNISTEDQVWILPVS